jgi:hypothetical protein
MRGGCRHFVLRILGKDTVKDLAAGRIARPDGYLTGTFGQGTIGMIGQIQPQTRLLLILVRTMTGKTFVGKDRLDIDVIIQLVGQLPVRLRYISGKLRSP